MRELKNPFYTKQIECPVCGNFTNNLVLKSKVVIPSKTDTDNYVLEYQWLSSSYKKCQPSFYSLWVCATCGYADFPENFSTFLHDSTRDFLLLKNAVLQNTGSKESVLYQLLAPLKLQEEIGLTIEEAMNIHLLAIYCHDILLPNSNDCGNLGRLYLRYSWLFRDYKRLNMQTRSFAGFNDYWEYLDSLKKFWPKIPVDEKTSMRKAAFYFNQVIEENFSFEEAVKNIKEIFFAAELYLKVGEYQKALGVVDVIIGHGMESRTVIQRFIAERKKEKNLAQQEEMYLRSKMRKISDQLLLVHEKQETIFKAWADSCSDIIDEVFKTYNSCDPGVIEAKLLANDVPKDLVEFLKNNDKRFMIQDNKKNFWKFWK